LNKLPRTHLILATAIIVLFALLNAYFVADGFYLLGAIPIGLIMAFLMIYKPKAMFFLIAFCTPLSVIIDLSGIGVSMNLPTEPLIFSLMVLYILRLIIHAPIDLKYIKHPLSILLVFNLFWMFITTTTSTMPLVSFKAFLSQMWFMLIFYFLPLELFQNYANLKKFIWAYFIPLTGVIIYAIVRHQAMGFTRDVSYLVCQPFFKEHTIYGATLALIFPVVLGFAWAYRSLRINLSQRLIALFCTLLFLPGIFFSFSRAAWVSLVIAFLVSGLFKIKIRFRTIAISIIIVGVLVFNFWTDIRLYLQENEATSGNNIQQQIQSIYNITNDESNTERLNRWSSAYRMFLDKPVFGFGPGTYMFKYGPYQLSHQKTSISTIFGDLGNAHSEYLGPLAESGFLGFLTMVLLFIFTVYYGMQIIYFNPNETARVATFFILISLITYFIHGFLNNFLSYDKASVPFWAFIAAITVFDVKYGRKGQVADKDE